MQIENNYQPNFKGVIIMKSLKNAMERGSVKNKRMAAISAFKTKYEKSPVNIILGKADQYGNRIDAQVFYGKPTSKTGEETYRYYTEDTLRYYLGFSPKKFLEKIGNKVDALEAEFHVGKYAKQ